MHKFWGIAMNSFLKKYIDPLVPIWALVPLLLCFALNCVVYWVTMALCGDLPHYNLTLPIDNKVPVMTGWIFIYLCYCYVFWALSYCYIAKVLRKRPIDLFRFIVADMMSRLVCMFFFIFLPTTNVRPDIVGTSFADELTRFLYSIDQPTNLFPSIHCLVSWLCFIGIRNEKSVPLATKIFSCVSAILIMLSTQFLKQHYVVDMVSGILLGELCFIIANRVNLPVYITRWYSKLVRRIVPGARLQ